MADEGELGFSTQKTLMKFGKGLTTMKEYLFIV